MGLISLNPNKKFNFLQAEVKFKFFFTYRLILEITHFIFYLITLSTKYSPIFDFTR
jgi:hypothetical protein